MESNPTMKTNLSAYFDISSNKASVQLANSKSNQIVHCFVSVRRLHECSFDI